MNLVTEERLHLLARLAAERSELLAGLLGLDGKALTEEPFLEGWTVKDALAHIAAWDRWEQRQMARMVAGAVPEDVAVDAFNAAVVNAAARRSLWEVVAELQDARAAWLAWLCELPDEVFFADRPFDDGDWAFPNCLEVQWQHDAEHAAQIAAWRQARGLASGVGPQCVLLAALSAAREELLAASALVPDQDRASRPVCGVWTLKDVLGHQADWEQVGVEGLRSMARGEPLEIEQITDIEAWNHQHAEARRDQPWDVAWTDLHETREVLLTILEGMNQADLSQSYRFPWGPEGTPYQWVSVFVSHDREHAQGLREVV
jgi:uncharacterized damage-inducible protein DinB